jgi:putative transposase
MRMTVRYRSRRVDDVALRERLRTLAKERRGFGYQWCASEAAAKGRWGRERRSRSRYSPTLDFVSDQLTCGRRFRILASNLR